MASPSWDKFGTIAMGKMPKFVQHMAGRNVTRQEIDRSELNLNLLARHDEMITVHHFMNKI